MGGLRVRLFRGHRSLLVATAILLAAGSASCGNSSVQSLPNTTAGTSAFSLIVHNIDGPPLELKVNGHVVADSACEPESSSPAPFVSATTGLPLPWQVELVRPDGSVFGSWTESGTDGPRQIVIRGDQASEGPAGAAVGPPPASCAP